MKGIKRIPVNTRLSFTVTALLLGASLDAATFSVKVNPLTAKSGETFKLVVTLDNCPGDTSFKLTKDSVTIAGSEVNLNKETAVVDACSVIYGATVVAKPGNRELTLLVTGEDAADSSKKIPSRPLTFR